jgi:hypothetical protein
MLRHITINRAYTRALTPRRKREKEKERHGEREREREMGGGYRGASLYHSAHACIEIGCIGLPANDYRTFPTVLFD